MLWTGAFFIQKFLPKLENIYHRRQVLAQFFTTATYNESNAERQEPL